MLRSLAAAAVVSNSINYFLIKILKGHSFRHPSSSYRLRRAGKNVVSSGSEKMAKTNESSAMVGAGECRQNSPENRAGFPRSKVGNEPVEGFLLCHHVFRLHPPVTIAPRRHVFRYSCTEKCFSISYPLQSLDELRTVKKDFGERGSLEGRLGGASFKMNQ